MTTESRREQEGWDVVDRLTESWVFDNHAFTLTIKMMKNDDGVYRLVFSQPANQTEDLFFELVGAPKKDLADMEDLSHKKYKGLLGSEQYGGCDIDGILKFLGVEVASDFVKKNH
jgi:hypothetical protein